MAQEVKIVVFELWSAERTERELEQLVNEGWVIVAAGGAGDVSYQGFVVLQKFRQSQR